MKVSVVTVVRNDRSGLARTIASVRSQTFTGLEFIVIDGQSSDGTIGVIQANGDIITDWTSEADQGIYDAMNKGLRRVNGEYVLFLNAGDEFLAASSLQSAADAAAEVDADVIYLQALRDNQRVTSRCSQPSKILFDSVGNHQAVLIRTETHRKFAFDARYRIKADRDVQLRMHLAGCRFAAAPRVISRFDGGGVSSTRIPLKEWENVAICIKNRVGLGWTSVAVVRAIARVSLFGICRLSGLHWDRLKQLANLGQRPRPLTFPHANSR